jgi:uncharacterized lipoprotein
MKFQRVLILMAASCLGSLMLASLGGCAKHDQDYVKQANEVKPLKMPEGINLKDEQNYYATPEYNAKPKSVPSIIPPGSNLEQFKSSSLKTHPATLNLNSDGESVLVLDQSEETVWPKVLSALKASDYQVLDKDRTMSSFYILDVQATGNQITEKTPIYRVFLQPIASGAKTQVSLLSEKNFAVKPDVAKKVLNHIALHAV